MGYFSLGKMSWSKAQVLPTPVGPAIHISISGCEAAQAGYSVSSLRVMIAVNLFPYRRYCRV